MSLHVRCPKRGSHGPAAERTNFKRIVIANWKKKICAIFSELKGMIERMDMAIVPGMNGMTSSNTHQLPQRWRQTVKVSSRAMSQASKVPAAMPLTPSASTMMEGAAMVVKGEEVVGIERGLGERIDVELCVYKSCVYK